MARHKLIDRARYRRADCRDVRRQSAIGEGPNEPEAREPGAARRLMGRELLEQVRRRLADEERRAADLRGEGRTWAEVAVAIGGTAEGRRKQLARALDRVARDLDIDAGDLGG